MGSRIESLLTLASLQINRDLAFIIEDGCLLPITRRRRRSINSRSSRHWDIELATRTDDGFALLARRTSPRRNEQHRIFFTNQDGEITSRSPWIAREELANTLFYDQNTIADDDNNGIVDGSEQTAYQIYSNGEGITITDRRGRTFNDGSNRHWDVTAAGEINDGFAVLRAGTSNRRSGQYRLWFTTAEGRIQSGTSWESGDFYEQQGYENVFNVDLNNDGQIGDPSEPPIENDGEASILITGDTEQEGTLSVLLNADDPDGNGDLGLQLANWEYSNDNGLSWTSLGSSETLTVTPEIADSLVRARLTYIDDEGFDETIISDSVSIPALPPETNDDFGNTTGTSGRLNIGSTATGTLEENGDRDWFEVNLTIGSSYNFAVTGEGLGDPYLRLYDSNGVLLDENDDYSGLNSAINGFQPTSTGQYYLGVGAWSDAGTGSYLVSASESEVYPPGYSPENGYGQIDVQRAFEQHLGITLDSVADLGGNLWSLDNINAPEVWTPSGDFSGATGNGTVVAVVDTGVDLDHREFSGRIVQGYDFVSNDSIADDGNGHGTHVAGTIAGANDGFGVTGVAYDALIMPIRVLDNNGSGYTSDVIDGIFYATNNGADVINLSLGGGGYSQAMADAIAYATSLGSVVVMAAGNSGGSSPDYPAAHAVDYGLAVGAVDQNGDMASFSNLAGDIALDYVTAPGVNIYSSTPGNNYDSYNGTSMATPHVAGAAALLMEHDPNLSAETIEDLLTGTASNNYTSTSSTSQDSLASSNYDALTNYSGYVTSDTIGSFSCDDLTGTWIGRLSSDSALSSSWGDHAINSDSFGWEQLTNNLFSFELNSATGSHSLISELLNSNQFDYFEADQVWSIA